MPSTKVLLEIIIAPANIEKFGFDAPFLYPSPTRLAIHRIFRTFPVAEKRAFKIPILLLHSHCTTTLSTSRKAKFAWFNRSAKKRTVLLGTGLSTGMFSTSCPPTATLYVCVLKSTVTLTLPFTRKKVLNF